MEKLPVFSNNTDIYLYYTFLFVSISTPSVPSDKRIRYLDCDIIFKHQHHMFFVFPSPTVLCGLSCQCVTCLLFCYIHVLNFSSSLPVYLLPPFVCTSGQSIWFHHFSFLSLRTKYLVHVCLHLYMRECVKIEKQK